MHVPLNESTKGLISKDEIALMKPDAVLINTARGPVVDSEALAEALNNGKIAGAAVDVFENEPPVSKDHPLLHAKESDRDTTRCICNKRSIGKTCDH